MFEVLIIVTGLFALVAAILEWHLAPVRIVAALLFMLQGVSSFPYLKEDRYKIGLAVGCVAFFVSGLLALFIGSWWPVAGGLVAGYGLALLLGRGERQVAAVRALWKESLPARVRSVVEEFVIEDNLGYIAFNMALIRCALEDGYGECFSSKDDLFLACGVVDTGIHITDGDFGIEDLKNGFRAAKLGTCRLGLTAVAVENELRALFIGPADLFLNFTLQIEAMCFAAGEQAEPEGLSEEDTILGVLSRRDHIERVLRTPKRALQECRLMKSVGEVVTAFMESEEFADLRSERGLG